MLFLIPLMVMGGCRGIQSALDPHGPEARAVATISWALFLGAAAILLLVMALALYAVYRPPERRRPLSPRLLIAAGGVGLPVVALSALLGYDVYLMRETRAEPERAVRIDVTGHRWWWEVHYREPGGQIVTTANEIRIPVGVSISVSVQTSDVIHSFWVPNLAGKIDMIPGRTNRIVLRADRPGTFRGQCAEYCGAQHALMAFLVVAEPAETYAGWLQRQAMPAREPVDAEARRGREAFIANGCIACHTVRGVSTAPGRGPDLTHVASRRFLAAGTLENNRANLIEMIAHAQKVKPGIAMPSHEHLEPETLAAIATYLDSLH